jgi:putative effector of murein hydrolase LrgA (UPF0299 family)
LVIGLVLIVMGIQIYVILNAGLKKSWGYYLTAIILFGVHEIVGILEEFEILKIEGLYDFTELAFIIFIVIATIIFRKLLLDLVRKGIGNKPEKSSKSRKKAKKA